MGEDGAIGRQNHQPDRTDVCFFPHSIEDVAQGLVVPRLVVGENGISADGETADQVLPLLERLVDEKALPEIDCHQTCEEADDQDDRTDDELIPGGPSPEHWGLNLACAAGGRIPCKGGTIPRIPAINLLNPLIPGSPAGTVAHL